MTLSFKYNKNIFPIAGVILILVIASYYFKLGSQSTVGFTTLSLTQGTNYISSDPFFNSPVYSLVVVANGASGYLRGTFTPQDVKQYTNSVTPSSNFDIAINVTNETCFYSLANITAVPLYSYSWQSVRVWGPSGSGGGVCSPQYSYDLSSGCRDAFYGQYCSSPCCYYPAACANIIRTKIGDVYLIDSVAHYNDNVAVSLITQNNSYSININPQNTNGQIGNTMRASLVGGLQGTQNCPTPASNTVIYRPVNTNQLYAKSNTFYSQIAGYALTAPLPQTGPDYANQITSQFLASNISLSSYCLISDYSGSGATYSCIPSTSVYIPQLQMYVRADTLGVVVPSGSPKIISVNSPLSQPAQTTEYDVVLQNIGAETDSFDVSIMGTPQLSFSAARTSIGAGQTTTIPVYLQGAGIIGQYSVVAKSVNSPTKIDSFNFTVKIDPFCDKTPEVGKIKVSTEFGCYYICPNGNNPDVREKTCQSFGSFEPRDKYNTLTQTGLDSLGNAIFQNIKLDYEKHCVGIGQYRDLTDYMDSICNPKVVNNTLSCNYDYSKVFVPPNKANLIWLSAPTCNYVAQYGYHYINGQLTTINGEQFNYQSQPPSGNAIAGSSTINCPSGYQYISTTQSCQAIVGGIPVCAGGSSYNPTTNKCEIILNTTVICTGDSHYNPQTNHCENILGQTIICAAGTVYNSVSNQCEIILNTTIVCSSGANFDPVSKQCIYIPPSFTACLENYTLQNGKCVGQAQLFCPTGYTMVGTQCFKVGEAQTLQYVLIVIGIVIVFAVIGLHKNFKLRI